MVLDYYGERLAAYCDTVIQLTDTESTGGPIRAVRVLEVRKRPRYEQAIPYAITEKGIIVTSPKTIRTGYRCIDYLLHLRLERAQTLLSNTRFSINEVARQAGYPDQNYFSSQFNKRIGISPSQYRQQYRA